MSSKIFCYNVNTGLKTLALLFPSNNGNKVEFTQQDFYQIRTIQTGPMSLFALKLSSTSCYSIKINAAFENADIGILPSCLTIFKDFTLVNFQDKYVFVVGAMINRQITTQTLRYDLEKNTWQYGPEMNTGRWICTGCSVGDAVYVFGGLKEKGAIPFQSFEKLTMNP